MENNAKKYVHENGDTNKMKIYCKTLDRNIQKASLAKTTPKRHDKFES